MGTEGRAPYGARGLKLPGVFATFGDSLSRPVWGAWIEIEYVPCAAGVFVSRAPYGARGLK